MIDIFEILNGKNMIAGTFHIDDLIELFLNDSTSKYAVSMVGKGNIILKDKEDNSFKKIECCSKYFNIDDISDGDECHRIKEVLGCSGSCKQCYECALKKYKNGTATIK